MPSRPLCLSRCRRSDLTEVLEPYHHIADEFLRGAGGGRVKHLATVRASDAAREGVHAQKEGHDMDETHGSTFLDGRAVTCG
jgi:hypothetical protein